MDTTVGDYVVSIDSVEELWRVGAVNLPKVGIQYSQAAVEVHKTALNDNGAFNRSEGGMSPLSREFIPLRNDLQDKVLVKTQDGLVKAGDVVCKIADSFATTDYLNAQQLKEYGDFKVARANGPANEAPPTYIPSAPTSKDTHPENDPTNGNPRGAR